MGCEPTEASKVNLAVSTSLPEVILASSYEPILDAAYACAAFTMVLTNRLPRIAKPSVDI